MVIMCASEEEKKSLVPEEYWDKTIITGIGMINALDVISKYLDILQAIKEGDTPIINVGYAGALNIPVGTVCVPCKCRMFQVSDIEKVPTAERQLNYIDGYYNPICLTAHDFVSECPMEGDYIFDMELAAYSIVPNVYSIKVVSDNLNMSDYFSKLEDNYHNEVKNIIDKIKEENKNE